MANRHLDTARANMAWSHPTASQGLRLKSTHHTSLQKLRQVTEQWHLAPLSFHTVRIAVVLARPQRFLRVSSKSCISLSRKLYSNIKQIVVNLSHLLLKKSKVDMLMSWLMRVLPAADTTEHPDHALVCYQFAGYREEIRNFEFN